MRVENRLIKQKNALLTATSVLQSHGFHFERKNQGNHFIIFYDGGVIDFYPTTDLFINRADNRRGFGLASLLAFMGVDDSQATQAVIVEPEILKPADIPAKRKRKVSDDVSSNLLSMPQEKNLPTNMQADDLVKLERKVRLSFQLAMQSAVYGESHQPTKDSLMNTVDILTDDIMTMIKAMGAK